MHRDLGQLEKWSNGNIMKLSTGNAKPCLWAGTAPAPVQSGGGQLESSSAEKVLVANKVTMSQQHVMAAEEISVTLGCMSRSTASSLCSLCLVLDDLGCCTQAFYIFTPPVRCYAVCGNSLSSSSGAVSAQAGTLLNSSW